jgi:chromosome segregation ATPase
MIKLKTLLKEFYPTMVGEADEISNVAGEAPPDVQSDVATAVANIDPRDAAKLARLDQDIAKINREILKLDSKMAPLNKKKSDYQTRLQKLSAEKSRIKDR